MISYSLGIIPTRKNLALCEKVTASAFCRLGLEFIFLLLQLLLEVKIVYNGSLGNKGGQVKNYTVGMY